MHWLFAIAERLRGYTTSGTWRLYPVESGHRRRYSLPERVPVPREEWRRWPRGQRPERLAYAQIRDFAERFLAARGAHRASPSLATFVAKSALVPRAEAALKDRAWPAAEAALREILALDPEDERGHYLLALALLGQERPAEAAAHLERSAAAMAADADYHVARGRLHEWQGDAPGAAACYRRALALTSGHPLALDRLEALGEMVAIYLGDLDHPEKAYLPRDAYEELILKGWDEEPRSVEFFLDRARCHLFTGQAQLSLAAAERARIAAGRDESAAGESQALVARLRALLVLARCEEAREALADLERVAAESPAAVAARGQWSWFCGERAAAAAWIERALEMDPNQLECLRLYLDADFPRAVRDPRLALEEFLRRHPQSSAGHAVAASLAMAAEAWDRGMRNALRAVELGVEDGTWIELTGRLGRAGRHGDVRRLLDCAGGWQRFVGAHPLLRNNAALSLAQCGEVEGARALWRSLAEDPGVHPGIRLRARGAAAGEGGMPASVR